MDSSPLGSSVHGIFQARIVELVAISRKLVYAAATAAKSLQSCPTLCDLMDCSPSGFSVHGIFQARRLEWVAISSSRRSSQLRDQTLSLVSPALARGFFTSEPPGKPNLLDTTS